MALNPLKTRVFNNKEHKTHSQKCENSDFYNAKQFTAQEFQEIKDILMSQLEFQMSHI